MLHIVTWYNVSFISLLLLIIQSNQRRRKRLQTMGLGVIPYQALIFAYLGLSKSKWICTDNEIHLQSKPGLQCALI